MSIQKKCFPTKILALLSIGVVVFFSCQKEKNDSEETSPNPPSACTLVSPADQAQNISAPVTFSWERSQADPGVSVMYKFYLSSDNRQWNLLTTQSGTSYTLTQGIDTPGATYYWKIETIASNNLSATSQVRSFTTTAKEYYQDGQIKQLLLATQGKGVNIVILGDGFVKEDLEVGGAYEKAAMRIVRTLDLAEPYRTYKNYFNVYCIFAESNERGADYDTSLDVQRDTKFDTRFDNQSMSSTYIIADTAKCFAWSKKLPDRRAQDETLVIVMVNAKRNAGYCHFWIQGKAIAFAPVTDQPPGEGFEKCVLHEALGHGLAKLGDEYLKYANQTIPDAGGEGRNQLVYSIKKGLFPNIDTTDVAEKLKWKDLVDPDDERYNCVGAFEGAWYWGKGVWRSEVASCMINNIKYFNAPSRLAIVKRIMFLAGEPEPTIEQFKARDVQMNRPHQNVPISSSSGLNAPIRAAAFPEEDFIRYDPPAIYFD